MIEVWKDIKDYEGLYQISNLGRVKSLKYRKSNKERILILFNIKWCCQTRLLYGRVM